jgi:RHS repeat-associated protein
VAYLHRDHLGSTTTVTNEAGAVVESLAYEPFGKRRVPDGHDDPAGLGDPVNNIAATTTERGFTNHEHLDELGLIHMNGRIYDPLLGRFTSADPTTPNPLDLQSYNRYSYTRNNPLRMLDPSGFTDEGGSWFGSVASMVERAAANVTTTLTNWKTAALDSRNPTATQPESQAGRQGRDPSGLKSAVYDTVKGGWNAGLGVVEGVPNLIAGGAIPGGIDYNAFLSPYRAAYDTPAFGATVEVLTVFGAMKVLGEIGAAEKLRDVSRKVDYSKIENPQNVGPGKEFTLRQKQEALALNKEVNGGIVKSDQSGASLVQPEKSQRGVTPNPNEWQFDHKISKNCGGTNCSSNIQILSRQENRLKSDN